MLYIYLQVTISDNGEPTPLTSVTLVVVVVQDVQDSAVAFLKEHLQRYVVPAWKPPKALPLFRIIAFDTDVGTNAAIQFSLVGKKTENERYRIDAKTGEVFAVQALNVGDDYNVVVSGTGLSSMKLPRQKSNCHFNIKYYGHTTMRATGKGVGPGRHHAQEDAPDRPRTFAYSTSVNATANHPTVVRCASSRERSSRSHGFAPRSGRPGWRLPVVLHRR